ncbi:MAG: lactate racemase domain-containing protein [Oscillospiraceae bacterium]
MESQYLYSKSAKGISETEVAFALARFLADYKPVKRRVLLLPPDGTRLHSGAGGITNKLYHLLSPDCVVDILPALGTHAPMTGAECRDMFGDIPQERFFAHSWREDVVTLGVVPGEFTAGVSDGVYCEDIPVQVNRRLVGGDYDLILSVGQVVPHEVVGMSNYSKNILVGCGGSGMINASHCLGAFYGLERMMGRDHSPVRAVFDYAEEHFLKALPLKYILTVTTASGSDVSLQGLFLGGGREGFERAVALSREKNLILTDEPLKKVVVRLDGQEYKSTWLGNKAIYRTRMAIADGGELVILAPSVRCFGEDPAIDALIRKYGYRGREAVIRAVAENADLRENLSAAAHLIHGSSDGRFSVAYAAPLLSRGEIEGAGFSFLDYGEACARYSTESLAEGFNILPNGERIYYISNPALGLWAARSRFETQ